MPRTLTPTLTTAVGDTTRVPVIATTCEDHISHYNQLAAATTAQGQNFFNACIANDGSIIRVWVVPGSPSTSFQYQRITNPSIASQWATWTTFGGTSGTITVGAACCVSNNSGTLRAFAQHVTGSNEIWTWSSTDNGVTWSASPSVVFTPLAGAVIRGLASAGHNDIFIQYDTTGGKTMGMTTFNSTSWSAIANWPGGAISGMAGLAVYGSSSLLVKDELILLFSPNACT